MGGVTSMDGFLDKCFPSVKAREAEVPTVNNLYCQYNSQTLQLMTSSLFIAGAVCELSGTTGFYLHHVYLSHQHSTEVPVQCLVVCSHPSYSYLVIT